MSKYFLATVPLVALAACSGSPSAVPKAPQITQAQDREVIFKGADGFELHGAFLCPPGWKLPAMLLLPGSGPTDRDGNSSLGIKPEVLKQLANNLYAQGIATLRFDKRAIARYKDQWPSDFSKLNAFFSWRHFVDDATGAYRYMRSQPQIDPTRTGIMGHSEGGLITLQISSDLAQSSDAPKSIVLLGTSGRPMGIILHEQIARQLELSHSSPELSHQLLDYTDEACAALAKGEPLPPNTPAVLKPLFNPTVLDIMGAYCRIDPTELAKNYRGPVLIVNGQNDTQVSAERDTPALEKAFRSRNSGQVELLIAPDASHNLKRTVGGNDDAFDGGIVPEAVKKIDQFLGATL